MEREADEDEEPSDADEDGADDEPSLGSNEIREAGAVSYLSHPVSVAGEMVYDCEGARRPGAGRVGYRRP